MKKSLEVIGYVLSILVIVWIVASFVDVNLHNMSTQQYAWWNAFALIWG